MSDTSLGRDFVQHRPTCRCDDCHADRLQSENRKLNARIKGLEADLAATEIDRDCWKNLAKRYAQRAYSNAILDQEAGAAGTKAR